MRLPATPVIQGFRCSVLDVLVLLIGAGVTLWLNSRGFILWWTVPVVLGHFFLFCNVFRVWRKWELAWALTFVIVVSSHLAAGYHSWQSPVLLQTPVTLFVLWMQIRSPWYHGILVSRINPGFQEFPSNFR